jgi:hypothetical protein
MVKHNRTFENHKFNVPTKLLEQFDAAAKQYTNTKPFTEEYYRAQEEFCNQFDHYMVG